LVHWGSPYRPPRERPGAVQWQRRRRDADGRATAEQLLVTDVLAAPVNHAAIAALDLPAASRGLDAGCGIGLQSILLTEVVGPGGGVVPALPRPSFPGE
jgi:hypothetical protein